VSEQGRPLDPDEWERICAWFAAQARDNWCSYLIGGPAMVPHYGQYVLEEGDKLLKEAMSPQPSNGTPNDEGEGKNERSDAERAGR
jgi:hypothetical protein